MKTNLEVCILGPKISGKTLLASKITKSIYSKYKPTIACQQYIINDNIIIWDTSSLLRYYCLHRSIIKRSKIIIFCYNSNYKQDFTEFINYYFNTKNNIIFRDKKIILFSQTHSVHNKIDLKEFPMFRGFIFHDYDLLRKYILNYILIRRPKTRSSMGCC